LAVQPFRQIPFSLTGNFKQKIQSVLGRSPTGQTRAAEAALRQVPAGLPGRFASFENSPSLKSHPPKGLYCQSPRRAETVRRGNRYPEGRFKPKGSFFFADHVLKSITIALCAVMFMQGDGYCCVQA